MAPTLKSRYRDEIVPELMSALGYKNAMQAPKLEKVVVNMGLGRLSDAGKDDKVFASAVEELAAITGQRAVVTRARKSIAGFKLREGVKIGCKVTLRGERMLEFVYRLVNLTLPQVRDFRGLPLNSFDGNGNYTIGLKEQTIFPEIDSTKVDKVKGMNITFVTTAKSKAEAVELLRRLGVPFKSQ